VLERGYAICLTPDGKVIRSTEAVEVDDAVNIRLHQGRLSARVTSKE
jgi:exonuclease VII large subunit